MNRIEIRRVTRDDPDTHKPGLVTIDGVEVRVRRNYGVATPRYLWDVVHAGKVIETFASVPSGADCHAAIARSRSTESREEVVARVIAKVKAEGKRMSGRSDAGQNLFAPINGKRKKEQTA
jgi:hypothetical protein